MIKFIKGFCIGLLICISFISIIALFPMLILGISYCISYLFGISHDQAINYGIITFVVILAASVFGATYD